MTALREFQMVFGEDLRGRTDTPNGGAVSRNRLSSLGLVAGFDVNMNIYRNNVRHAHVGALKSIFPAVAALVGEDYFDQVAHEYAIVFPAETARLSAYGAAFPDFISGRSELADFPFLPGVAKLEGALNEAFHAPSAISLVPGP